MKFFRVFLLLSFTVMLLSSCSDDDTLYTGQLSVEFTEWEAEWNDKLYIYISPIDNKDAIIKQVKANYYSDNKIELNPGNYIVRITTDDMPHTPDITRKVQIQVGKTEVIKI